MYFGPFGGRYVPEMLQVPLEELAQAYDLLKNDESYKAELQNLFKNFAGRPTPLTYADNLSKLFETRIYLKNEGLNMTGAHKMNHCLGQGLIAKRLGKTRVIAETGAGQHGLATATMAAKLGLECTIFMGAVDVARQRPNVFFMEQLGAKVVPVEHGSKTLKEAVNEAIKDWVQNLKSTHYVIGSALGPDPYPRMNRDFQSVIGYEVMNQISEQEGTLPTKMYACVGGGSNSIGFFYAFLNETTELIGVEAGGRSNEIGEHARRIGVAPLGVNEGYKSFFLQTQGGNIAPTHSIAAGLDYPGIGPEVAHLASEGRIRFTSATDQEVIEAWQMLAKHEGIIAALESSHAMAGLIQDRASFTQDDIVVVNISGRGDKDLFTLARYLNDTSFSKFLEKELEKRNPNVQL